MSLFKIPQGFRILFKQKKTNHTMDDEPPSNQNEKGTSAVGVLEQEVNTSQGINLSLKKTYSNNEDRLTLDKFSKSPYRPLEHIAKVELLLDIPKTYILPKGTKFCPLLLKDSICNTDMYKDTNCFEEKARGCKIYQRYSIIKRIFKKPATRLKLLRISDYLFPVHKG